MKSVSDSELITMLNTADPVRAGWVFETIYQRYAERVFAFNMSLVKDKYYAQDLLQQVFCTLWARRHQLDNSGSLKSLLFTITYNEFVSMVRKRNSEKKKIQGLSTLSDGLFTSSMQSDYEFKVRFERRLDAVIKHSKNLPPRQREIFGLRLQGKSHKEIAESLDISVRTVEHQIESIMKKLKENITDE